MKTLLEADLIQCLNDLREVRHNLAFYSGLVATDRPDLHDLDTDRDKNTVFKLDTHNELVMLDRTIDMLEEFRHDTFN